LAGTEASVRVGRARPGEGARRRRREEEGGLAGTEASVRVGPARPGEGARRRRTEHQDLQGQVDAGIRQGGLGRRALGKARRRSGRAGLRARADAGLRQGGAPRPQARPDRARRREREGPASAAATLSSHQPHRRKVRRQRPSRVRPEGKRQSRPTIQGVETTARRGVRGGLSRVEVEGGAHRALAPLRTSRSHKAKGSRARRAERSARHGTASAVHLGATPDRRSARGSRRRAAARELRPSQATAPHVTHQPPRRPRSRHGPGRREHKGSWWGKALGQLVVAIGLAPGGASSRDRKAAREVPVHGARRGVAIDGHAPRGQASRLRKRRLGAEMSVADRRGSKFAGDPRGPGQPQAQLARREGGSGLRERDAQVNHRLHGGEGLAPGSRNLHRRLGVDEERVEESGSSSA
jgi:hypothetical protein